MDEKKPSEVIEDFIEWAKSCSAEYEASKAIVAEEDAKWQDFLHALEFQGDAKERAKIATIIHRSRERRREAKDRMELLEKPVAFLRREQTKLFLKSLRVLAQDQKREEERLAGDRTYIPRTSVWSEFQPCPLAKGGDESDDT